jgi:hypothetical protein
MLVTFCRKLADDYGLSLDSRLGRGAVALVLAVIIYIAS